MVLVGIFDEADESVHNKATYYGIHTFAQGHLPVSFRFRAGCMIKITCRPRAYGGFSRKMSVRQKWDGEEVEPLYEGTSLAAVD